jgi:hypothetical protein
VVVDMAVADAPVTDEGVGPLSFIGLVSRPLSDAQSPRFTAA